MNSYNKFEGIEALQEKYKKKLNEGDIEEKSMNPVFLSRENFKTGVEEVYNGRNGKWVPIKMVNDSMLIDKFEAEQIISQDEAINGKDMFYDVASKKDFYYEKVEKKGKKINESEADVSKIIKDLANNFSGSNEDQMKAVQLLKGLATSDDPKANEFMKALDTATTKISKDMGGKTESIEENFSDLGDEYEDMEDIANLLGIITKANTILEFEYDDTIGITEFVSSVDKAGFEIQKIFDKKFPGWEGDVDPNRGRNLDLSILESFQEKEKWSKDVETKWDDPKANESLQTKNESTQILSRDYILEGEVVKKGTVIKKIDEVSRTRLKKPYEFDNDYSLVSYGMNPNGNHTITIENKYTGKRTTIQTNQGKYLNTTHMLLRGKFKDIDSDTLKTIGDEIDQWMNKEK